MRNTSGQLPERSKLLRLNQAVLGGSQVFQRFRQFAGARLHTLEQAHILDSDGGLVGEGRYQLDLLVGEWPHLATCQRQNADWNPSRNIGRLRIVRKPPSFCALAKVYSGSA